MSRLYRSINKTYRNIVTIIFILILIYSIFALVTQKNFPNITLSTPTQTPSQVLGQSTNKKYPVYPDPNLTPGEVFVDATKEQICISGYSSTVRAVTTETKRQVYAEYGLTYPQPSGGYEVDHFISLELGGSNDIKNLWPEPANPKPGFHEKDQVENYLHSQLCSGAESLKQVQEEIRTDWISVYNKISK